MFRVTLFSSSLTVVPNTFSILVELTLLYCKRFFLFSRIVSYKAILIIIFLSANAACNYAEALDIQASITLPNKIL
jgi:hypothetical protein